MVNYRAVARAIDVSGDVDAVATAIRRYAEELAPVAEDSDPPTIRIERPVRITTAPDATGLLSVGDTTVQSGTDGAAAALLVSRGHAYPPRQLAADILALETNDLTPQAVGLGQTTAVIVVAQTDGPDAIRVLEDSSYPSPG